MRQRTNQRTSEKSALQEFTKWEKMKPEKANRQRERSLKGRRKSAVKSAGDERIAFNRGSQLYEVNLSKETHRKAAKSGSTVRKNPREARKRLPQSV